MRSIPTSLQEKINKVNQTIYENANPQMNVRIRRAKTTLTDTDLFYVETIREMSGLGDIGVALYRPDPNAAPTFVFEIHVENGMVKTTKRDLSDFRPDRWKEQFTVGLGKACSIEFNGYWQLDSDKRYNLITEERPYIFWTDNSDNLFVQKWDDIITKTQLSSNVIKVSSIRGWKNVLIPSMDQGLICAYIKSDGKVYYRNLAEQEDGSIIWEVEKEITQFTPPVQDLGLFRTNDYRTGFIAESNGAISWILTQRAWAGMAIQPENISVGLKDFTINVYPINYICTKNEENISAGITEFYVGCAIPFTPTITEVTNSKTDTTHMTVKFSNAIYESLIGKQSAFTLKDSSNVVFSVISTAMGIDQTEMILTTSNYSSAKNPMTLTYNNGITTDNLVPLLTTVKDNVHFAIPSGDTIFTADVQPPQGFEAENISAGITNYAIAVTQVYYKYRYNSENLSVGLNSLSIVVTKVGSNPL